jgi:hypothetical protein
LEFGARGDCFQAKRWRVLDLQTCFYGRSAAFISGKKLKLIADKNPGSALWLPESRHVLEINSTNINGHKFTDSTHDGYR